MRHVAHRKMQTSMFSMLAVLSYVAIVGAMPAAENDRRDGYVP